MITLDVPLAVLAVLFRRFLDSFHCNVPVQAAPVAPNSTALIILSSALYYLYKNLNRGTLVRLSSKNRQPMTNDIHPISNKQKTSSWLLRNLRGTRHKYTLAIRQFADQSMENLRACKALTSIGKIHTKATLNQPTQKPLQPPPKRHYHHHLSHKHSSTSPRQESTSNRHPHPSSHKLATHRDKSANNTHTLTNIKPLLIPQQEPYHHGKYIQQDSPRSTAESYHPTKRLEEDKHKETSSRQQSTSTRETFLCPPVVKLQAHNVATSHGQQNQQNQHSQQSQNAVASCQQNADNQMSCCHDSCQHHQVKKVSFEVQTEHPVMIDASTHSDMTLEVKNRQHVIDLSSGEQLRRRDTVTNIGGGDERKKRGRKRLDATKRIEKVQSNRTMRRRLRNGKTIASIT